MSLRTEGIYISNERQDLIREIQDHCADLLEREREWDISDGHYVASLFNRDPDPTALFTFMDEKTGDHRVGYRTRDEREWFPILRQMRNQVGSGLMENIL